MFAVADVELLELGDPSCGHYLFLLLLLYEIQY